MMKMSKLMKISKLMKVLIMANFPTINRFRKRLRSDCNASLTTYRSLPIQKSPSFLTPLKNQELIATLSFQSAAARVQSRIPAIGEIYE